MITCRNGKIRGYWYQEGYVRTSSYTWNISDITDTEIHLTNDSVQKNCDNYGKYEPANKISFNQLQRYLEAFCPNGRNIDFRGSLIPAMKKIAADAIKATCLFLDPERR